MIRQQQSDMKNHNTLKERWLEKLRVRLRVSHGAWKTEQAYVRSVALFWDAAARMPRDWTRERKVESWLSAMVRERDVSASTQNTHFNALVYFFKRVVGEPLQDVKALRARRKPTLRVAVDRDTTLALLEAVPNVGGYSTNFISRLIYGCGLRVTEPLNIRIKDVDLVRSRLSLWETKGDKCRMVALPCSLAMELRAQMEFARALWKQDVLAGIPIALPGALARKYPGRVQAWNWFWLFPQLRPCRHPRTGETVRYRMHEANVQRAVRVGARAVGLEGVITPHNLRHCYGTHVADSGQNLRALQQALGHKSLETTQGYVHADGLRVRSPLEWGEQGNRTDRTDRTNGAEMGMLAAV
jgi:integrase